MPILKREDIVGALKPGTPNPFDSFVSELPTGVMMTGAEISGDYQRAVDKIPRDQYVNFGRSSMSATSRVAGTVGIADYALRATVGGPLGELGKLVEVDLEGFKDVTNPNAALRELARQAGMRALDEALDRIATKVPIAGAVVKVGLFLTDIFRLAFQEAQEEPPPPEVQAVAYDRDTDQDRTQARLEWLTQVGTGELTKLFLPFYEPDQIVEKRAEYTQRGSLGVTAQVAGPKLGGWQHVPGTAIVGDFWQYPTPYRYTDKGDRYLATTRGGMATGYAGLHPSVSQLSLLFWQMVIRNGPDAFRIDGDRIAANWQAWWDIVIDWARDVGGQGGDWAKHKWSKMAPLVSWASLSAPMRPGGGDVKSKVETFYPEPVSPGGNLPGPAGSCPGNRMCVPAEYVDWRAPVVYGWPPPGFIASWGGLVRFIVQSEWRDRLPNYLRTLTCAYVPEKAPALRMDSALAELHGEMRRLLPTRTAVRLVDSTLIPDREYRNVIERAQRTAKELALPDPNPPKKAVFAGLDGVQPVDPEGLTPIPASMGPAIPGEPSGTGWGWKAAAALVMLGLLRGA